MKDDVGHILNLAKGGKLSDQRLQEDFSDLVRPAVANIRSAIEQLQDALQTHRSMERPKPRSDAGRLEDGSPTPRVGRH
jgi:hypothetical protein